jgi:CRISPR/Cas system-associated exonuclease Cas4 (RecB family)
LQLTKTDFILYLKCPESLWLFKNKPDEYPLGEFSLFLEKLIKEGYEVEELAKELFQNGMNISDNASPEFTKEIMDSGGIVYFQASFITPRNVFARIDVLERLHDDTWHLYEIKSSTSIKKDSKHNHLKDTCFQKYVLQENDLKVSKVSIIHLNKEYIKQGEINAHELLEIEDITKDVDQIYSTVVNEINTATTFINNPSTNEDTCSCRWKTRSNHCDSFSYYNTDIPEFSIYEIGRISAKKVSQLIDNNQTSILDIPLDFELNLNQQAQVESVKQKSPIISILNIENELSKLIFPLHFIDYETYASAIPRLNGLKPHQHLPFQVSIHTLLESGELHHFEYLAQSMAMPSEMITLMQEFTDKKGTFISWHASFEIGKNKDMMSWLPEFGDYLQYVNEHMFDLETIFKKDYVDYRFHGSTSIKKVLPVIVPELSYSNLDVSDGTMALDTWGRMVLDEKFDNNVEITRKNLLEYCKLDTLAMVQIYKFLLHEIKKFNL